MHTDDGKNKKITKQNKSVNDKKNNNSSDFSDFYNVDSSYDNEPEVTDNNEGGKSKVKIIVVILLLIVLAILVFVLIKVLNGKKAPEMSLSTDIGENWSNKDVTIDVANPSNAKIKYTINCDNNCDYVEVTDNKILISNSGESKITVVATSENNVETKKDIVVKIDKTAPAVTLSPNNTKFSSSTSVTVCGVCTDNESGCKEAQVCKTYNSSVNNEKIMVYDNAGNSVETPAFSVSIGSGSGGNNNTATPTCSLSVSSTGIVTAKHSNATAYGFSTEYKNENSKTLSLGRNEEVKVNYYVKNSSGKTNSCSITVTNTCKCTGKYRTLDGHCYNTIIKTVENAANNCKGAGTRLYGTTCYYYGNEIAITCSYSKK